MRECTYTDQAESDSNSLVWNLDCSDITKVNVTTSTGIEPLSLFKEHISLISRLGHLNISNRILNNIKLQVIFINPVYPKKKKILLKISRNNYCSKN